MKHRIKMFLKFGSEENIKDLYDNGTIYINTIEYFRKLEDGLLRGDHLEGASKIINSLPGTLKIPGIDRELNYIKIQAIESFDKILGNIYCLYYVSKKESQNRWVFRIDERINEFGTHCLLIKDNVYFLNAIETELKKHQLHFSHNLVAYYDKEKISKKLNLFEKSNEYEYQKEFRFYVENDKLEAIKIQIGSLHGKAVIYPTQRVIQLLNRRTLREYLIDIPIINRLKKYFYDRE